MGIEILSAGAAQGVVAAFAERFRAQSGHAVDGTFGAVGTIKERLLGGAAADIVILTRAMIGELARDGHVRHETRSDLGAVSTAIAVKQGAPVPEISSAAALRELLRSASGIYFPDPQRATAGIHFASVLAALGIQNEVRSRLRPYPNGATAMREMAQASGSGLVGCTQITEINNTPGVALVGPLPHGYELATTYSGAVCARASFPDAAGGFLALITGAESRAIRIQSGFEV